MAPEDRDRNFEKALARHMHSSGSRGAAESLPLKMAACPDAETLAAFHERSLLPEEWDRINLHVAGCSHCMTLLAQLEATDAIPLEAHAAAESQTDSLLPATAAFRAAAATAASAAIPAPAKKSRRVLRLPGARWHYLAPAGALAAGLLVWIAIHENHGPEFAVKHTAQVAENKTIPSPTSPSVSAPVPNNASEFRVKALPAPSIDLARKAPAMEAEKNTQALDDLEKDKSLSAKSEAVAPLSEKESNLKKDRTREESADAIRRDAEGARDQKLAAGVSGGAQPNSDVLLQAQNNAPFQNQANINQATGGPTPLGQATSSRSSSGKTALVPKPSTPTKAVQAASGAATAQATPPPPPPPPSAPETQQGSGQGAGRGVAPTAAAPLPAPAPTPAGTTGAVASSYAAAPALETVGGFANPRMITVPGSSFVWIVGPAGTIRYSHNDGKTWTRQTSGVTTDLLTGSAPSDKVCWIVGRAGTILLTTDGGAHWKLLKAPFAEDAGGIRATDALHATVWNVRNNLNFQTNDGGTTWMPVPNP